MAVVNVMEYMVTEILDNEMKSQRYAWCTCSVCRDDITALTLNHLPPHYVSSDLGMAHVRLKFLDRQAVSDVIREVTRAVLVVGARPRHGQQHGADEEAVNE